LDIFLDKGKDMFLKLFLAFIIIPFAEIYVVIKVGSYFGAFNTVMIMILTAFLGAFLARLNGLITMLKIRESLSKGILPAEEMIDAILIFLAGIVLITPGFITDIAGLLILFPKTRVIFKRWLRKKFDEWINQHGQQSGHYGSFKF
jgi:UPF0716 protein FxsA